MKTEIKVAIRNLIRLNSLRLRRRLNKVTWQEFFLYKKIVKHNAKESELTDEVKDIISK